MKAYAFEVLIGVICHCPSCLWIYKREDVIGSIRFKPQCPHCSTKEKYIKMKPGYPPCTKTKD